MCLAAIARQRGRRAARAPSATSRSRAKGGVSSNGHCTAVRGKPRRPDDSVWRAESDRSWREVSCVTEEGSDVVPRTGATQEACASNGWRVGCLDDTPRLPHATAREYESKGSYRNSLRNPNDLPGRERIAHHNLALRPVPRPPGAAGEQAVFVAFRAVLQFCRPVLRSGSAANRYGTA